MDTVSLWGTARQWSGVGPCWEPECHWGPGRPVFLHPVTTSVPHGCEGPPLIGGTQIRSNVNSCCGNSGRMYLVFNSLRIYIYIVYTYMYIYTHVSWETMSQTSVLLLIKLWRCRSHCHRKYSCRKRYLEKRFYSPNRRNKQSVPVTKGLKIPLNIGV